ncbi:MAG: NADH-quinone oxidoreductase subunit C [Alphaproteobacteria bacterium]
MFQNLELQANYLKEKFPDLDVKPIVGDNLIIYVSKDKVNELLTFLRDDSELSFKTLLDLFGADLLGVRQPRFEVIYNLLSYKLNNRITIKVALDDNEIIPSVGKVFINANWYEREAFDMYGIVFSDHDDLRRILTDYNFEGYPLRKDFPLTGYTELRYDEDKKEIVLEPVNLNQEFRNFDFEMPWQGTQYSINKDQKK